MPFKSKPEAPITPKKQISDQRWEAKQEQIMFRVPKGTRAYLQEYVKEQAKSNPDKYAWNRNKTPALSSWIISLIENEIGQSLSDISDSGQSSQNDI